jgi:hypothetical protein
MEPKIKWRYDKKFKEWWIENDEPDGDQYCIKRELGDWSLSRNTFHTIGFFKKLKNAKLCAWLLLHG